jgi:dimethylglycine dehydrogenase
MEHQYMVTEHPAIVEYRSPNAATMPISFLRYRPGKTAYWSDFYEQDCKTWGGWTGLHSCRACPGSLDRVMDVLEGRVQAVTTLMDVGIKNIVNIDAIRLTVRRWSAIRKRNAFYYRPAGGSWRGGGHGWLLAQQIVHGVT